MFGERNKNKVPWILSLHRSHGGSSGLLRSFRPISTGQSPEPCSFRLPSPGLRGLAFHSNPKHIPWLPQVPLKALLSPFPVVGVDGTKVHRTLERRKGRNAGDRAARAARVNPDEKLIHAPGLLRIQSGVGAQNGCEVAGPNRRSRRRGASFCRCPKLIFRRKELSPPGMESREKRERAPAKLSRTS